MKFGFKSDVGKKRPIDEDSIITLNLNTVSNSKETEIGIFIVSDGMGGHNAGEIASSTGSKVVAKDIFNCIIHDLNNNRNPDDPSFYKMLLEKSIIRANSIIFGDSIKNKEHEGMGTTIVVALIIGKKFYLGNVGDSRAYFINENEIRQLTKDHSLVQELLDKRTITAEQAINHPQKNIVTRIVGYYSNIKVDTFNYNIFGNDKILLCCDGLTDLVSDNEIKEIVINTDDLQESCEKLVKSANDHGGNDNISVILIHPNITEKKDELVNATTLIKN